MRCKLIDLLFAMLGLMLWTGVADAIPAGMVIAVSGSCTGHGCVPKRGDVVQVPDRITVPAGGHLQLRMADGSVVSVAPGSSMTVARYNIGSTGRYAKLSLTQGLLRVLITPASGPSTFQVATAVGTASVRSGSADWFIKAQADSAQVGVLAGTVELTSALTRQTVSIPSHWGTRSEAGLDPVLPRRWAQREFNAVIHITECCQFGDRSLAKPSAASLG